MNNKEKIDQNQIKKTKTDTQNNKITSNQDTEDQNKHPLGRRNQPYDWCQALSDTN